MPASPLDSFTPHVMLLMTYANGYPRLNFYKPFFPAASMLPTLHPSIRENYSCMERMCIEVAAFEPRKRLPAPDNDTLYHRVGQGQTVMVAILGTYLYTRILISNDSSFSMSKRSWVTSRKVNTE